MQNVFTPKEYGAKVIGTDTSGRYLVQILEDNTLEWFAYHKNLPACSCIKWRGGYLEFCCSFTY